MALTLSPSQDEQHYTPPTLQKRPDKGATDGGKETLTSPSWMAVLRVQRKYDCFFLPAAASSFRGALSSKCSVKKDRWKHGRDGTWKEGRKGGRRAKAVEEGVHFSLESSRGGQQAGRTD